MDEQLPTPEPETPRPPSPPPPLPAAPPVIGSITMPPVPPRAGAGWKVLCLILFILLVLVVFGRGLTRRFAPHVRVASEMSRNLEEVVMERNNSPNKIATIEITGVITGGEMDQTDMDFTDYIKEQFKQAGSDNDVKAVILKVNSPGGEVLASDDIYNIIRKFEDKHKDKPVVVSMGALAASGGYYISSPCRWIVANELTLTGSIGVIMHGYNYRVLMDKVGVRPLVFKSGRFKDMLSGEREPDTEKLTPQEQKDRDEEDQMVQSIINETYDKFKEVVQSGRQWAAAQNGSEGHPLVEKWEEVADGRVLTGKSALQLGFVDELGDFNTAVKRAETLAGISNATLVEYRVPFDLGSVLAHVFGKTATPALKVDLGFDLPKLQAGYLYFMAPTVVPH
ncbi:MAG: signal peptide peptidase SppA [Verrucomicrobiota bacterium]|jgi:protease-4